MVVDFRLQRAAIRFIDHAGSIALRAALSAEIRARTLVGADERWRALVVARQLRELLADDDMRLLDIACGREPDAGQARVLDVAEGWIAQRGQA